MNDAKLELRAYAGMTIVIQSANAFLEAAGASHPPLADLPAPKQAQLLLLVLSVSLFDAQDFFWDEVIADKTAAQRFEKWFYTVFRNVTHVSPGPRLKDHRAYLDARGVDSRSEYLGVRICEEILGDANEPVASALNSLYATLQRPFRTALAQVWDMPDDVLAESKVALSKPPADSNAA